MPQELVPAGKVSNGQALILLVPTILDTLQPALAELAGSSVKRLTYSITGDGYKHGVTINKVRSNRFTLPQEIQGMGDIVDDLAVTYVYNNTTGDVARLALPVGFEGFIVERWAVANEIDLAAGQLVDVLPIRAGIPLKDAPARNAELTRTQDLYITGPVRRDVAIV